MKTVRIALLSILLILTGCASMAADNRLKSNHFNEGKFKNLEQMESRSFFDFLKARMGATYADWPDWVESDYGQKPVDSTEQGKIIITHINHSTVLIQTGGYNILTDPIYSDRASPISFAGPKRVRNPGIRFEDLPRIDAIIISHDHYDHLDLPTINRLIERDHPKIYLGLGVAARLDTQQNIVELDWWETSELSDNLKIHFVPVQHFSGRTLFDRMSTLWGGYVLEINHHKIYFGGDSGYGGHYTKTYQRYGAMDLAIIPMGGYEPHDFMGPVHMNPKEAVQAHRDLHSNKSIGIHFGTFQLTAEPIDEPQELLIRELADAGLNPDVFITLKFGEPFIYRPAERLEKAAHE